MPVLPGPPPVEVHLRRSARARRFSLRVSRLDGEVTLSMPARAREAEALAFLRGAGGLAARRRWRGCPSGGARGRPRVGDPGRGAGAACWPRAAGAAVRVEGDQLLVPGDPARAGARVAAWLKVLARDRLAAASTRMPGWSGAATAALTLRDTRSRWGSCSPDGRLMYSWRLIMAPPSVLDYVAAHEVAHLVEMNHSAAYWAVVSRHLSRLEGAARLAARRRARPCTGCAFRIDRLAPAGASLARHADHPRPTDPNAAAHERVYRSLRQQVMHGEMDPGQALTLRGLGKTFGVSMTPAREAVRRLVAEGALTLSSSGRISTPELTPGADRGTGGDPRAAGAGDGRPRAAARPFRADRAAGGDQRC